MSDFKEILLNKTLLSKELKKLTPLEGNEVRKNIDAVMKDIPQVSAELLSMLEKEGLSLEQLVPAKKAKTKKPLILEEQNFYVNGDKVEHKAAQGATRKGATVMSYADLNDAQKIEAKVIVDGKNALIKDSN